MFHVYPRLKPKEMDYSNLLAQKESKETTVGQTPDVPDDDSLPEPPPGFAFYRVQNGDTLVTLALKFNVSQNRLRRFNREICFGHRLAHIVGKLILVPMVSDAKITTEIQEQLEQLLTQDESKQNMLEKEYKEPDEQGKQQLRRALTYHTKMGNDRANYYLGEANWNVRKALELYRKDDIWEKKQTIMTTCKGIKKNEAEELLKSYNGDTAAVIKHWKKQQKRQNKENERIVKNLEKNKRVQSLSADNGIEMQTDLGTDKDTEGVPFNGNDKDKEDFTNFRKCCDNNNNNNNNNN